MAKCIFCDICEGKSKSWKVFEDAEFCVILDAFPVNEGHLLLLPKKHTKTIYDLSDDELSRLFLLARRMAKALETAFRCDSVNIATTPAAIDHFHVHVIPRYDYDMMGPLACLDNKRELPAATMDEVLERLKKALEAAAK